MGKKKKKMLSESETREAIINLAKTQGVEDKVRRLIAIFENAVKGAKDENERKAIAALGLAQIHKTIGCVGALVVDGVEVLPEQKGYDNEINECKGLVRLD